MAAARKRWLLVVAAIGLALIAAMNASRARDLVLQLRTRLALAALNDSLDAATLPTARFSAISRTGAHASMRSATNLPLNVQAAAGEVIAVTASASSPSLISAGAAALVVNRQTRLALATLEAAVLREPRNAMLWSDLAAARYEADRPLQSLVAADTALRVDPRLPEALFNRGLALERLGLLSVAAESWRFCLAVTNDASLAVTIRDHLRVTEAPPETARWQLVKRDYLRAAAAGDDATVARITRKFPSDARKTAEVLAVASWTNAMAAHDAAASAEALRALHSAARALSARGDGLLADVVRSIDAAMARDDRAQLESLVSAHLGYDRGRRAYANRDYATAERELRDSARAFEAVRSPMAVVARHWQASVLIAEARSDEALPILEKILVSERRSPDHRAMVAASAYLLAICETVRGGWNAAADHARDAAALYRSLGETSNAADSEGMFAEIFDLLGQPDVAWDYRMRAIAAMSAGGLQDRLLGAVGSATRGAMRRGEYDVALSLLDVEASLAASVHDPLFKTELHRRRALVQHALGAVEDRDSAMARARACVTASGDAVSRAWLDVELDTTEGVILRDRDPQRAIALLDRTVEFVRHSDRRFELPAILLERGRADVVAGQDERAWSDFSEALDELETQRSGITDLGLRSRMLDTSEQLFQEAIAFLVRRGDAEKAFAIAERARGRTLLDILGGAVVPVASSATVASRLAPGALLIEYAVLPRQLVVFTIRDDGLRMRTVPVAASELAAAPDPARFLLDPIRDQVAAATSLIIVPDGGLQRTQFAALRNDGRYLVETHVLREAPSASLLVAAPLTPRPRDGSILIVGNPAPDAEGNLERLPAVQREIDRIRPLYGRARVLFGAEATRAQFVAEAPAWDVIHFAGHGLSDEESLTASLMFAHTPGASGRMESEEIARLRLPRAPLVVLDACGTLRGRVMGVEGMPSLARSFLAAGASAVVGTLEDIDDERSAAVITSFHRHMAEGASAAEALRAAQLEALQRGGEAANPKNWAPFVVYAATP